MTLPDKNSQPQINFTESALKYIMKLMDEHKIPADFGLRISAEGAIGSPINYSLGFDPKRKPNDYILRHNEIIILVDSKSGTNLDGTLIDYISSEEKTGFVFNNPNQTRTCGGCKSHTK